MIENRTQPPRSSEGDRAKRGGGESRFIAKPMVQQARELRKNITKPERYIIEIEGSAHDNTDRVKFDDRRVSFLKENGFRVLRVKASRVLADADDAAEAIVARMANPLHQPAAGPPPRAGEAK